MLSTGESIGLSSEEKKILHMSDTTFNDTWCFIAHKDEIICLAKSHQEDEINYPKSHQILSQHSKTDLI